MDTAESTNNPLLLVMDTNRVATAVYLSDAFAAAWPLVGRSGSVTANNAFATAEPGEPGHAAPTPYKSIWWQVTPAVNGRLLLNTYSSSFNAVVAVYTGSAVTNLRRVAANYTPGGMSTLTVTNAMAGVTYYIAIDSAMSWSYGRAVLNWSFVPNSVAEGAVIINELMIDPAAIPDADGEWVELRNTTNRSVNLTGWTLKGGASGTVPLPAFMLAAHDFLVLCRNVNPSSNGGISGAWAATALDLNNGPDSLWLYDATTQLVDVVAWGSAPAGASLEVRDPWQDNFSANGSNWAAASVTYGAGDYGTPGRENSAFIPEPGLVGALFFPLICLRHGRK